MKPKLYVETTIPSYLVARRSRDARLAVDQAAAEQWWQLRRADYELHTSAIVVEEIMRGEAVMAAARVRYLEGVPRLPVTPAVASLTKRLLREQIVPTRAEADAAHITFAAVHGMDFLPTWNCKHINNPHTVRRIERACEGEGCVCPVICNPAELLAI